MNSSKVNDPVSDEESLEHTQVSPKRKLTTTDDKSPKSPKITEKEAKTEEEAEEEVPPLPIQSTKATAQTRRVMPIKIPINEPVSPNTPTTKNKKTIFVDLTSPMSDHSATASVNIKDADFEAEVEEVSESEEFIEHTKSTGTSTTSKNTQDQQKQIVEDVAHQPISAFIFETSTDAISDTASNYSHSMFSNMSTPPPTPRVGKSDEDSQ